MNQQQAVGEGARQVPYDIDVEQALLGAVLVDNFHIARVTGTLKAADFYDPLHQRMWAAIEAMHGLEKAVTPLTLFVELFDDPGLAEVGGRGYLQSLSRAAPALPHTADYARILSELATRRALIRAGEDLANACFIAPIEVSVQEIMNEHQSALSDLEAGRPHEGYVPIAEAFDEVVRIAALAVDGQRPPSVSSGIPDLDKAIGGLQGGDVVIVAGRPGMGKTVVITTINRACAHAVETEGKHRPSLLFSIEMMRNPILQRLTCDEEYDGRAPDEKPLQYFNFRSGHVTENEFNRFYRAQQRLRQLPLFIWDGSQETMESIGAKAERIVAQSKHMGVVCIDYMQIVTPTRYMGSKVAEVTDISMKAKRLAKRLGWPLVLGCQLSRETEKRQDPRPTLADLRESGAIEQDGDIIIGCYRPEYYVKNKRPERGKDDPKWMEWLEEYGRAQNKLELNLLKNKHGPTYAVQCFCDIGSSAIREKGYIPPASAQAQELMF